MGITVTLTKDTGMWRRVEARRTLPGTFPRIERLECRCDTPVGLMPRSFRAPLLVCASALSSGTAVAGEWNASVALTSNYLVHARTRSADGPALQTHVGWVGERRWSAGVWASTIDLYPDSSSGPEFNFYVASDWSAGRHWRMNSQLTRYTVHGDSPYLSYDYTEITGSVRYRDSVSASVAWMPDYSYFSSEGIGRNRTAVSYELTVRRPIGRLLHLSAGVGSLQLGGPVDSAYAYWSGGGELAWRRMSLALAYIGADHRARRLFYGQAADATWVATLAWRVH